MRRTPCPARSMLRATFAFLTFAASLAAVPPAGAQQPNSAHRVIIWTICPHIAALSDADLDTWKSRGIDGFVCQARHLAGMGGTQEFSGDPGAPLTGNSYELQRQIRDTRIIERMRARDMKAYLGVYLVNLHNAATPLEDWFADERWERDVLPRFADVAGAAKQLGFAGIAFDQEMYAEGPSWSWSYAGNTHTEEEVRAKAKERGAQIMQRMVSGFPGLELMAYDVNFPQSWNEIVQEEINDRVDPYARNLDIDFWDGLSSVEGYGAIRLIDATFYKGPHIGTWDNALEWNQNSQYAYLSQRLSNWDYASSRFFLAPFGWIDEGPEVSTFDDARSPGYVADQLAAFQRWTTGGEFAVFDYGGLDNFDYGPYLDALRAASTPATVDTEPPALEVTQGPVQDGDVAVGSLAGRVKDNMAVRSVRWENGRGGSGAAKLEWNAESGDYRRGVDWHTTWTLDPIRLHPGRNEIAVVAEDIRGLTSKYEFTALGPPEPPAGKSPAGKKRCSVRRTRHSKVRKRQPKCVRKRCHRASRQQNRRAKKRWCGYKRRGRAPRGGR